MHRSGVQYQSLLEFGVPGSVNQWPLKWGMLTLLGGLTMEIIRFYLISISSFQFYTLYLIKLFITLVYMHNL